MLERQRVKFEAVWRVRVPVLAQRRATRGHLDDRDGCFDALRHLFGKAQLRTEVITRRLHRNPALRSLHVLTPKLVGEQNVFLRLIQPRKRRKAMDVLHPRVRADHVRLAREDENAQRLGVGVSAVGCGSEEDCGKEKFHAPELGTECLTVLSQMNAARVKSRTRTKPHAPSARHFHPLKTFFGK